MIYLPKIHTLYSMKKTNNPKNGICYLIGAGPGDIGLLTLKAADCLKKATTVFYDYLASRELLTLVPDTAEIVYVGKSAGNHTMPQEEINRRIIAAVAEGETVARLKGGDPFVFGRGGEEAIALKQASLPFEIVPGISAGIAAAAYAGIPVTHRAISTMVTFVTGHETPDKTGTQTDWEALARVGGTICIYMGVKNLPKISRRLIEAGRDRDEPVAVIHRGTSNQQQTVTASLQNIAQEVHNSGITAPALIVIGRVVDLRQEISWFEQRPLFGKRVLVTRARSQASKLTHILQAHGAEVIEIPAISIFPVEYRASNLTENGIINGMVKIAYMRETNPTLLSMIQDKPMNFDIPSLEAILDQCDELTRGIALLVANKHQWVVFTSTNGVEHTFDRINRFGLDSRIFVGKEIAAIGTATAEALADRGIIADVVPEEFTGEALLETLKAKDTAGEKIIMFRASNARKMLREELEKLDCEVDDIVAYRVGKAPLSSENREILQTGAYDIVTFGSSGTVRNFAEMTGEKLSTILNSTNPPAFISIGPVTSQTMQELGIPVSAEAKQATIHALVEQAITFGHNSH